MIDKNTTEVRPIDEYTEAAIQRLLTEDTSLAEQGIHVVRRDHTLVLFGEVESHHRREQILQRVTENFPEVPLLIDIGVTRVQEPMEAEELS